MFLLESIDLIALIGLFVQTLLAWVFVAVAASLKSRSGASRAFDDYFAAFIALALGLTVMSVRFFRSHEVTGDIEFWRDGAWFPSVLYSAYLSLKIAFGFFLVRGSAYLADRAEPSWLRRALWPGVSIAVVLPWIDGNVNSLLVAQAPVMVACALLALRSLSHVRREGIGLRVVRGALLALAISWSVHAAAVLANAQIDWMHYVLSLNSFLDTGVQLALGIGWMLGVLEDSQHRLRAAEEERERLRRELERDERLRALGTLVSGVAHELNNPLTAILGHADLLRCGIGDEQSARVIGEQAERCRAIVRDLSALGARSPRAAEEIEVRELVARVVRGFSVGLRGPGGPWGASQRLRVADFDGIRVRADRVGLEQVLTNLVANALQASPATESVELDAHATEREVVLTITDRGPGIPRELRARVFEPFFTTKAPGRGSGLGLAIAHAIVRSHGGTITLEDGPDGRGTRARVGLPRVRAAGRAPTKRVEVASSAAFGKRLLIVDDEAAVRSALRVQAERRGWLVTEVDSAESALALGHELADFDAWLCDLRMPGIGGIELHDRLSEQDPALLERAVFVTGDLASTDSVRFADRCRRPLVQKPFDFDELFATLSVQRALPVR
ncbi:MAG: ATP-binding protein [Planctomycetes bacterium]|nr:ATP-binding protein [Planctomycetota bacterium]